MELKIEEANHRLNSQYSFNKDKNKLIASMSRSQSIMREEDQRANSFCSSVLINNN